MESLSQVLQPYKNLVGAIAGYLTILQVFSGCFLCNDIRKKGTSSGFSGVPFIGGCALSILFLQHAMLLGDYNMITPNLTCFSISVGYAIFFWIYTPKSERGQFWKQVGIAFVVTFGLLFYVKFENEDLVEPRFGSILTVLLLALIGEPLLHLGDIIEKKSTEGLPFALILSGTIVSFFWLLYGIIIKNTSVVTQNTIGFSLSVFQLSLFIIYPSRPSEPKTKVEKKKD